MTTIDLYKKHKAGEVSRESFLYEVRRDAKLPWITNLTSYNDAVTILKNKGIIRESVEETKVEETKVEETPVEETYSTEESMDEKLSPISDEDIEIYTDELGPNTDKKMLGKFFAENNLYEREEDALLKYYGFYNDVDDVMDVLRYKDQYKSRRRAFAEDLQEGKKKQPKTLDADHANPYQYRLGIQYELECSNDYTDEGLEKAKAKTLRNLAKNSNYYTALEAKKSSYTFKETETNKPGMQATADGMLKKGAGKNAKANVKDNLGNKEKGTASPKGVKEMTQTPKKAKGISKVMDVPGKPKVVKEGISFKDFFLTEDEAPVVDKKANNIAKIKAKLKKESQLVKSKRTGATIDVVPDAQATQMQTDLAKKGVPTTKTPV